MVSSRYWPTVTPTCRCEPAAALAPTALSVQSVQRVIRRTPQRLCARRADLALQTPA